MLLPVKDRQLKGIGILFWIVSASFCLGAIWGIFSGIWVIASICLFLAVLFFKWGRNCYYDLRSDQRNDSLPDLW